MSPRTRVWLEAWPRWAPPLAALLVAGLVLLLYPLRYADRIERLAGEAQSLQEQIDELAERRRQLEERMDWRRQGDAGADRLLDERLGTRPRRLTTVLRNVHELAARVGIQPPTVRYSTESARDEPVERVSWSYSVVSDYERLRRFLHLIESADDFLILDDVRLAEVDAQSSQLRVQLGLATVFAWPEDGATRRTGATRLVRKELP